MRKNIPSLAENILKEHGLYSVPVDVSGLAKKMNIEVQTDFAIERTHLSGFITHEPETKKSMIWINPLEPIVRQRFTLAHELGHAVLHMSKNKSYEELDTKTEITMNRDGLRNGHETEANEFSANLLMPESLIIEKGNEILNNFEDKFSFHPFQSKKMPKNEFIKAMAEAFNVSKQTMEIRLEQLGILEK